MIETTKANDVTMEEDQAIDLGRAETGDYLSLRRTARVTGLWYLAMAISGLVGFLIIRPQIYGSGDAATILANLVDDEALARLGLLFEMALVVTQSLAAVWFFKLFRTINHTAAWGLAVFGMMNAVAIMASAVFMATALGVAGETALAPGQDLAATVQLLFELSDSAWGVGATFFGLWLVPMGYLASTSGRMPKLLGWILMVGGFGYLFSAFTQYAVSGAPGWVVEGLTIPASIGEFWMIAYLLIVGIRPAIVERAQQG